MGGNVEEAQGRKQGIAEFEQSRDSKLSRLVRAAARPVSL